MRMKNAAAGVLNASWCIVHQMHMLLIGLNIYVWDRYSFDVASLIAP